VRHLNEGGAYSSKYGNHAARSLSIKAKAGFSWLEELLAALFSVIDIF